MNLQAGRASDGVVSGAHALAIHGYASLWNVADLNGDVLAKGAFAASLAKTGVGGVRMLHQHEARSVVGVWDRIEEDERGLYVEGCHARIPAVGQRRATTSRVAGWWGRLKTRLVTGALRPSRRRVRPVHGREL